MQVDRLTLIYICMIYNTLYCQLPVKHLSIFILGRLTDLHPCCQQVDRWLTLNPSIHEGFRQLSTLSTSSSLDLKYYDSTEH